MNRRLVAANDDAIAFRWKDLIASTARVVGRPCGLHPATVHKTFPDARAAQGLPPHRHYGLFANANRAENIAKARALLNVARPRRDPQEAAVYRHGHATCAALPMPRCGGRMIVIEVFARGCEPRWRPIAQQGRHIMSRRLEVATFPFRCAGSTPRRSLSTQSHPPAARSPVDPLPSARRNAYCALPTLDVRADIQLASCWRPAIIEIGANINSP